MLVINKDHENSHPVNIAFEDSESKTSRSFSGPVTMITFGKAQYQWHPNRKEGYADPDGPAASSVLQGTPGMVYTLPAASVSVFRGNLAEVSKR